MHNRLEVLAAQVLKLTPTDRSHLLERLIDSLDVDPAVEAQWEQEADRREAEWASDAVEFTCSQDAINRLRAKLSTHPAA